MRNILIVLSSVVTIAAVIPYIVDILKRNTKPRIASWFIWAVLAGISAAASLSNKQYAAFVLALSASVECLAVVLLGLKYGEREFKRFDVRCLLGALIGLLLWYIFNSPEIAILADIVIDLIGSAPTLKHAWEKPAEETWITFALSGLGAVFAASAATTVRVTSLANPIYIILINLVFTVVLLSRHKIKRAL